MTAVELKQKLEVALPAIDVTVIDDSHKHKGHRGATGGSHFQLRVVSSRFVGLSPIARHRLVYSLLAEEMKSSIHALAIEALTPDEVEAR